MMSLNRLMVLTDFTSASTAAAAHCYQLASLSNAEVIALHAISHDEDMEWARKKTEDQIRKVVNYNGRIPFKPMALSQNLFSGLNKWLENQGVDLTFMATHGKKDLQFVKGSHAMKLILNAEAPMVVVQHNTPLRPYKNILIPVFGHQAEMQFQVQIFQAIIRLSGARLTLLTPAVKEGQEKEQMQRTIDWIKGLLEKDASGIEVRSSDQSGKKFSKDVIAVAKEEGSDLIAVIIGARHHREESEKGKKFFQTLITNEEGLPVLCL
jgi:hypothetical protein